MAASVPRISVIVPVHDVADHVAACIASLKAQSFTDFEALVIDDGSTDGSGKIAARAIGDDPRFRLITQENRGLSGARNTGLDGARGDLIAFLDSDDRFAPDFLARMEGALAENGADWVACALRSCFADGSSQVHSAIHGAADLAAHPALRRYRLDNWPEVIRHFPSAWNKLYRRSLIEGLRFDEGTWFEDHGFFLEAAARSDHLLHLPEPLYLQTRDRLGQITASDDERVFEQLEVLRRMRARMEAGGKKEAGTGFSRIASRLLFERSTALRAPARRARFARAAAAFLEAKGLAYDPEWDADISRLWGAEMAGRLPLSVVLPWDGQDVRALDATLQSLAAQQGPGLEVLLAVPKPAVTEAGLLAAACPGARVLQTQGRNPGGQFAQGLAEARGIYVVFLRPGDLLHPSALLSGCETLLRHDARTGIGQFRRGTGPQASHHNGFDDMRPWPRGTPAAGLLGLTPAAALALAPELSARIFERDFLENLPLGFTPGARPDWALCLAAPLLADRVAYFAWPGVRVEDAPGGARARALPGTARGLARGHDALVRAVPKEVARTLPRGWQRRLFARALRDQIDRHRAPRPLLAGAALAALARGFSGPEVAEAGFDPAFGPRLARLLNPAGFAGGAALLPGPAMPASPALASPGTDDDKRAATAALPTGAQRQMFAFPLKSRGIFRFRADFHDHAYANLSFLAADGRHIPFHLSLRFPEQLAVANDTRADGAWRAERTMPFALPREGVEVTIEIAPPHLRVLIEGSEVFAMGRRSALNRGGLAGLEAIALLDLQGGIHPLDIMPEAPGAALALDPRLQLRMTGADRHLRIAHSGEALALTPAPGVGGAPALVADLTGRHWQGSDPEAALVIEDTAGQPLLRLTRAEIARRIAALMAPPPSAADAALALLCLDHLHHGALHDLLPAPALAALHALAATYGLEEYAVPADAPDAAAMLRAAPPEDTAEGAIEAVLTRLHRHREADPTGDPLAALREDILAVPDRQKLFLCLSEVFCREGEDFEGVFALARESGALTALLDAPNPGDAWTRSALLPYLIRAGHIGKAARSLFSGQEGAQTGWQLTPPLGWAIRHLLAAPDLPEAERQNLLYALMQTIAAAATDYWSHVPCRELTGAVATLLLTHGRSDFFGRDVTAFCLKTYGLSRLFWDLVDARRAPDQALPAEVTAARAAFRALSAEGAAPQEIDRGLALFERAGCIEAPRLRREMLGPAGLPVDPTVTALARGAGNAAEAALRHMACPGAAPVEAAVSDLVAAALPHFSTETPQAPFFALQIRSARAVRALLDNPAQTGGLEALLADLARLARADSGFLGLGMALLLVSALAGGDEARRVADWVLARWRALPDEDRARATSAPALRGPLARLAASDAAPVRDLIAALAPDLRELPAPAENRGALPGGSPLFDTLVVVFSCKPYLDSRIPALRDGWLTLLEALDIPHVVVVGDGDGRREGDIVHLDAPDDYEGLPQKTLAAIRWVHDNTAFAHMLKIDDDCFLNAPLFFESLSYRKFDYYGRKLTRIVGQMDRTWHQEKSTSARGKYELDRSAEPSSYADGGCGYVLSRRAMAGALTAAARPAGQRLIALSFMEDKMLGDLLALEGIRVAEEDYRVTIRRRTFGKAVPVSIWRNSFFPSRTAPLQLIHLDNHQDQQKALAQLETPALHPPKIWPSFQGAQLGYQSNALELLSPVETVDRARAAEVAVVAVMRNEMFMLPHFLAHYRALGVESFLVADNLSDDGSREYLLAQPDVAVFSVDTDYKRSHYGVAWQQALMAHFRPGKWSLVADADELLVWQRDQQQSLPELLAGPDFTDAEAARIFMLDMYPEGPLERATFESGDPFAEAGFCDAQPFLANTPARGPYSNSPTWTSALRHRLLPESQATLFVAQKLALLRYTPFMRLAAGLHFVNDARLAKRELIFGHFKYNAAFREKARTEVARKQHWGDAREYRKYLALASEGRSVIFDAGVSVPWHESAFVRARLD